MVQRLFVDVFHAQQRQRLQLMVAHPFAHVGRALHAATQLFLGGEVKLAQQALLPTVPERFVGGADIRHRQADQITQPVLRLHLLGELFNHFGILDVAALGGDGHQQVMTHQPRDKLGFARVQAVQLGEFQNVLRAQHRVVAAAPFGDIVKQRGDKDKLRVRQTRPELHAERVFRASLFFCEAFEFQQHANGVFIYRVGVKKVELHLPDDMRPLRHIGPQHAVAVHRQQAAADRAGVAQHRQKQRSGLGDVAQRLFQMAARVAQVAQRGGINAGDVAVTHHHIKHAQNGLRLADKERFIAQIDKRAAQLEIVVQHPRFFVGR
ncbi:hypothetical protein BN133_1375 [Cronobacter dublinensis 582]|nr:hypothetical protein BN133_1375 [Cronobacter dublinensis 582]